MIDDDFDKLVRNMFERFFGGSIRFGFESQDEVLRTPQDNMVGPEISSENGPLIDEIDLGNEYLIVVTSNEAEMAPVAQIDGKYLTLKMNDISEKLVEIEVAFPVNVMASSMTYRNGVVEIKLVKALEGNADKNEGVIRIVE
ncbi:MAG: hypothetical protein ACFFEF_13435 [Candidatus Thorarchaeota archaeon]